MGLKAPDLTAAKPSNDPAAESMLFNDSRWIAIPLILAFLAIGACAWWASGVAAYGVIAIVVMLMIGLMFLDISIFIG